MKVGVCIKQVPDTEARLRVATGGTWIDEEGLPFVINESDEYALEEALQIAEATGGEAVVVSLGPERVREALRKALALGAVRAIHLKDPAFEGSDAIATARALAAAISAEKFDLLLTGSQSGDVGYGSTGSLIAGHLGWPHAWLVMGVEVDAEGGTIQVTREMESGINEIARLSLPAVVEVQAGINQPRYASLRGIMQAKKKEIASPGPEDLGLEAGEVGVDGSRLEVLSVDFPDSGESAEILEGDPAQVAAELVSKLRKEARVL